MRLSKYLFFGALTILTAIALSGCGNYITPQHQASVDDDDTPRHHASFTPHEEPILDSSPTHVDGDPITSPNDPMMSGGDPLSQGGPNVSSDPLGDSSKPSDTPGQTKNWYWLRGSIPRGTLAISVNNITIGEFSGRMDKEITKWVHPGSNTLQFTQLRLSGPVQANLEVVYPQQTKGSPPVTTYICGPDAAEQSAISDPSNGSDPNISNQSDSKPSSFSHADQIDTREFFAE